MAAMLARSRWLAQITSETPAASKTSVGVSKYMVGTITTGQVWPHSRMKARISSGACSLLCTRIASAPARWYASARFSASARPQPAMKASIRATTQKSGSDWVSFAAMILPANSCTSASGCASPRMKEFVFGKSLSSMHIAATPRLSSLRTRRLALLKFP
jgi:hypothetical protein